MSYQVIARKWRPKSFTELIGQSHISQTLTNALQSDRLPHALLFTGPRGTGKTSSARILAKALRCENTTDFTPCNTCQSCLDIAAGSSVDVIEIDGASNNGVDAIRELRDTVGYMPATGKFKVYIIDEVHMLSGSAFNALLKTLEEPPEHIIFILATTEAHKIPNTILSRCQRFDFRRIPLKSIADHLQAICKSEGMNVEPEATWAIARQGDGSMRDSQSLLDQVASFCDGDITLEKAIAVLGLTDRGLLTETLTALTERNTQKVLDIVSKIFTSGSEAKVFVQDFLEQIRNLLFIKISGNQSQQLLDLPESEVQALQKISEHLGEEDIHLLFDMALKGSGDVLKALDPRITLEMLLLRMAAAPRIAQLSQLNTGAAVQAPARKPIPQAPKSAPQQKQEPAPVQVETQPPQVPDGDLNNKWSQLVSRIKNVNGLVAAKLEHSYLKNLNDTSMTVAIPGKMKFLHQQINEPDFKSKLQNYVQTFWGQKFSVEVELDSVSTAEKKTEKLTPKVMETQKKEKAIEDERRLVENHPVIKSANNIFKTQIKSIKEQS